MKYISIKTVLNDYLNSTKEDYLDEDLVLQWASDCLDLIGSYAVYVPQVVILNIQNYKAELPLQHVSTDGVYLYTPSINSGSNLPICDVKEFLTPMLGTACTLQTQVITNNDCYDCNIPLVETLATEEFKLLNPWLGYKRVVETSNSSYNSNLFIPLTFSHHLYNKYFKENCIVTNLLGSNYTIQDEYLYTEFESGKVLLMYISKKTDKEGFPMIPDLVEVVNAVFYYIEFKNAFINYRANKDNSSRQYFADIKNLKDEYMGRAKSMLNTPSWEEAKSLIPLLTSPIPYYNQRFKNART